MKQLLAIVAVLFCSSLVHARNVVVVLDSSGTMKTYGHWQPDAVNALQAVLTGGPLPVDVWEITGNLDVIRDYRQSNDQSLYFLPFGSIAKHEWPFFAGITKLSSPAELTAMFPKEGNLFSQQRTNKSLAIAVAGSPSGTAEYSADLIVISDFLIDANMTDPEIRYVDDFESASTSATPLILTWKKDPRLQIKFMRIRPTTPVAHEEHDLPPTAVIRLVEARFSNKPEALSLRWRVDGKAEVRNYDVYVRNDKGGAVYSAARLLDNRTTYPKPPSGKLNWYVIANLVDGTQLKSAVGSVIVPQSSSGGETVVIGLVLAVGGFAAYQWWKKKGIKERAKQPKSEMPGES